MGAGAVSWPTHLANMQSRMMNKVMYGGAVEGESGITAHLGEAPDDSHFELGDLGMARDANPYWDETEPGSGAFVIQTPYDPNSILGEMVTRFNEYNSIVDAIDVEGSWDSDIDLAKAKADEVLSPASLQAAESAFDTRQQLPLLRAMNRFSGGMADINAVQSTGFVMGQALMALQHKQEVANFGADLAHNAYKENVAVAFGEAANLQNSRRHRIDANRVAAHLRAEINRIRLVGLGEFDNMSKSWEVEAVRWNMELWQYYANTIASIDGAAATPGRGERIESSKSGLGGALTGAVAGAQIGAAIRPTSVGAGAGALVGGAAGFFASRD